MAHIADRVRTGAAQEIPPYVQHEDLTLLRDSGYSCSSTHQTEGQKYHLYPTSGRAAPSSGRSTPDIAVRSASSLAMRTSTSLCDLSFYQQLTTNKAKPKDVKGRKKISISEIGPMTTVQEAPMDSPTIPGRPPLHERSISAPAGTKPGANWRQGPFGDAMTSCITGPALQPLEAAQPKIENVSPAALPLSYQPSALTPPALRAPMAKKKTVSPTMLAPLAISTKERICIGRSPLNNLLDDDSPPEVPPKSPRKCSPDRKVSGPLTHAGASSTPLVNPTTPTTSPSSATEGKDSPKPLVMHLRCGSPARGFSHSLARDVESPTQTLDRGRPMRRTESKIRTKGKCPKLGKLSPVGSYKAFEHLPKGYRAEDAVRKLPSSEIMLLQRQAIGQVERFEILAHEDVETLAKELRALNERCEYLRKTFNSLRSGRRSLHTRMITYLRAPRLTQFSRESILKQEEALAELDVSIGNWVDKLSFAENRRTRIQQKLLEHIAATMSLTRNSETPGEHTPPRSPQKADCQSPDQVVRSDVESIKIYADSNVYALLADVEQEIGRMADFYDCSDSIIKSS